MPQLLHAGLQAALDRLAERHPAGVRRAARILVSGTRSVPLAEFAAYCVAGPRAAARPRGSADVPDARPRLRVGRVCAGGGIGLGPAAKRHVTAAGVARSRVHCSSVIGLSLITYLPISERVRAGLWGIWKL